LEASRYARALKIAQAQRFGSIAFPSISTGISGYPIEHAAQIAVATTQAHASTDAALKEILFCCFSPHDLATHEQAQSAL
jgi:O-acetyl-ADP-ribose deacetylase (regulator of RNase III)